MNWIVTIVVAVTILPATTFAKEATSIKQAKNGIEQFTLELAEGSGCIENIVKCPKFPRERGFGGNAEKLQRYTVEKIQQLKKRWSKLEKKRVKRESQGLIGFIDKMKSRIEQSQLKHNRKDDHRARLVSLATMIKQQRDYSLMLNQKRKQITELNQEKKELQKAVSINKGEIAALRSVITTQSIEPSKTTNQSVMWITMCLLVLALICTLIGINNRNTLLREKKQEISELEEEKEELVPKSEIKKLKEENEELKSDKAELKDKISEIQQDLSETEEVKQELQQENRQLREENHRLKAGNNQLAEMLAKKKGDLQGGQIDPEATNLGPPNGGLEEESSPDIPERKDTKPRFGGGIPKRDERAIEETKQGLAENTETNNGPSPAGGEKVTEVVNLEDVMKEKGVSTEEFGNRPKNIATEEKEPIKTGKEDEDGG